VECVQSNVRCGLYRGLQMDVVSVKEGIRLPLPVYICRVP
jgi:hypothetical protein